MYLLSDSSFREMEEELLKLIMESVTQKSYTSTARKSEPSPEPSPLIAEEKLSETARATLKVLRGEWSGGPAYDKLYSAATVAGATVRRDVAQAMVHRWTQDGRGYGAFDEIALELFRHCFDQFEGNGAASFTQTDRGESTQFGFNGVRRITQFGFDGMRRTLLDPFLEENHDSSLSVHFDLDAAKAPVKLKLEIGATGHAVWELRGASQLKKSHRRLRDDLQAVVRDFHSRRSWMAEYISSGAKPGIEEPQLEMVQKILKNYYNRSAFDLEPLDPGVRFEDEPIVLGEAARGFIGRCESCDQIVTLELVKHIGSSRQQPDWTDDALLYRNSYAEGTLQTEVFRPVHWACGGKRYLSSRTGQSRPIGS